MGTVQIATRIDDQQDRLFREITQRLGTTPNDAMRVFIAAFNQHRGFPFEVRLVPAVEPFATEDEATEFASRISKRLLDEAR